MSLLGRLRLPDWLRGRPGFGLASLLVVSFLVQSRFLTTKPIVWDISAYAYWGDLARHHFLNLYSFGGQSANIWQIPEYPPLVIYLFALVEFVYFGAAHHVFGVFPGTSVTGSYLAVLKLPLILAHLVVVGFMWDTARRLTHPVLGWFLVATYALSPAVLLDIHAWGQTDDVTLLLAVGALVLALKHRGIASGVVMGLMVVFKPQPLIFVPLALFYLLRWAGWRQAMRASVSIAVTAILMWSPYLLPFSWPPEVFAWLHNTHRVVMGGGCGLASCDGYNMWTLVQGSHFIGVPLIGPFSPAAIGSGLFMLALAAVLCTVWATPHEGALWTGAAVIALAFYTLSVLQYERYIFPALGLFLIAALFNRWQWPVYVTISLVAFVNLLIIAIEISHFTRLTAFQNPQLLSHNVAIALGALNCAALLWSVAIMALPQTRGAIGQRNERRQALHPALGLSQPGANLTLAPSEASHPATMRPLASGHSGAVDAALSFATSGAVETIGAGADALADTLKAKTISHSATPALRHYPRSHPEDVEGAATAEDAPTG
jgi:Gpi18-like mannosyltransferase